MNSSFATSASPRAILPVQRSFNFTGLDRACLALLPTVKCLLACDEDRVLDLIAEHELVAFDLRGPRSEKAFPGIWFQSIRAHWQRQHEGCQQPLGYNGEATALAIADLLPEHRDRLRLTEVARLMCVTNGHLHNLLDAKLLTGIGGDRVCQAPLITRRSVAEFLTARRM